MSLDLLDRLISDIVVVTEQLMETNASDFAAYQPAAGSSIEKEHSSTGQTHKNRHKSKRPMGEGVHRAVC